MYKKYTLSVKYQFNIAGQAHIQFSILSVGERLVT